MIIYLATNIVNGKQYVGQTVRTLDRRRNQHYSDAKRQTCNIIFHNAIRKYGENAFIWEVVKEYNDVTILDEAEKRCIALLNTLSPNGYNLMTGGSNGTHSEETKRKMSEALSGKKNPNYGKDLSGVNAPNYGRKFSEETKAKHREAHAGSKNGMFGKKHSKETKQKMRESYLRRVK